MCSGVLVCSGISMNRTQSIGGSVGGENKCLHFGSVSGSGTGPGDPGSQGPAMPDPETFPYEWLGVRQYIYMPCFMSVIGKQIEACSEYLKEIHKINKNYFIFIRLPPSWKWGYKSCNV